MRDGAQRCQMFDRLMGRAVFAEPDAVMREDRDALIFRQRRKADCWAHIIRKTQKGAAIRDEPAVQCNTVGHRSHCMLAHAKMDVTPIASIRLKATTGIDPGVIRGSQIGGTADLTPSNN